MTAHLRRVVEIALVFLAVAVILSILGIAGWLDGGPAEVWLR